MSIMLKHIRLLSGYNARFNCQVFDTAARLSESEYSADRGAFFKSVSGTLNHLLVGDILWFTRFHNDFRPFPALVPVLSMPVPKALDDLVFSTLDELRMARDAMDAMISQWACEDLTAADLEQNLTYANTKGIVSSRNFAEVIMHVFNHQAHHRGQMSTLLMQFGHDVGVTDFLADIPVANA
jgi:uncharacterized damage-inducible protein DinB